MLLRAIYSGAGGLFHVKQSEGRLRMFHVKQSGGENSRRLFHVKQWRAS